MVYLDNASTTMMSEVALKALMEVSSDFFGNPSSKYAIGRKSKVILDKSREIIANCIGAEAEEIFFTSGGTESNNFVVSQLEFIGKKVIISEVEHHAILNPAMRIKKKGFDVELLPVDDECLVSTEALDHMLNGNPTLVSVMMQNNETGTIQKIKEMSCRVHNDNAFSIFHTDAVQAVGHLPINVKDLDVDLLSASAHKFNGPKGVGFIYINKRVQTYPYLLGGGQEQGLRSGTENIAGVFSMAKALEENIQNLEQIRLKTNILEHTLIEKLNSEKIRFIINGSINHKATGILNLTFPDLNGEGLLNFLDMHDICISIGSACNSNSQERSHVLLAMGIEEELIDSSIRISIGRYNTEEDIQEIVKWIKKYEEISAHM